MIQIGTTCHGITNNVPITWSRSILFM